MKGRSSMGISLSWLLHESGLKGLRLLTAPPLQPRAITGVNILDNPETLQWIKPGELVLTTGYIFRNDPSLQTHILEDLNRAGCAALCFKTKRFFAEIPAPMVETAQALDLPIVELPLHYSLSDVSQAVSRKLYADQFQQLAHEQMLYNALFNAYFQGRPVNEILHILAEYLKRTVCILSGLRKIPWYAPFEEGRALTDAPLPLLPQKVTAVPGPANAPYRSGTLTLLGQTFSAAMLPLSNPQYTLCILGDAPEALPWDTIAHVLKIIDFTRSHAVLRHPELTNYFDSFFQYLLHPDTFSEASSIQVLEYYGLPHNPRGTVAVFSVQSTEPQSLWPHVQSLLDTLGVPKAGCFAAYNETLLCLCFLKPTGEALKAVLDALFAALSQTVPGLSAGVGRLSAVPLPQSFREASFALSLTKRPDGAAFVLFEDHLADWLVFQLPQPQREDLLSMTVKPLLDFDRKHHTNLTETLAAYFDSGLNASLAAAKLYIHRNTFLKRMEKIRTLTHVSTGDSDRLLSLALGLRIYRGLPRE